MSSRSTKLLLLAAALSFALPVLAADEFTEIAAAADRFAGSGKQVVISSDKLNALLSDGDPANAVDDGLDMSAAIKRFDAQRFMRLENAAELMPSNASRVYLELDRE